MKKLAFTLFILFGSNALSDDSTFSVRQESVIVKISGLVSSKSGKELSTIKSELLARTVEVALQTGQKLITAELR